MLTSSVSALETDRASNQAGDVASHAYVFEGTSLVKVLTAAADTMQSCGCQSQVRQFLYERPGPDLYRLSIFLSGEGYPTAIPEDWEIVRFRGSSLPKVLREAAKYVQNCACQLAVRHITYERLTLQPSPGLLPAPTHLVSLILESPPPD